MSGKKKILLSGAIAATLLLVPAVLLGVHAWSKRVYSDGESIRRSAGADSPRDVLWQAPRPLDELLHTPGEIYEPRLSWDGLWLFFVRGKAGANADLFVARRTPQGWADEQPLAEINTDSDELGPELSADGTALYFYSDRPGGSGGYDIWVARHRADSAGLSAGWESPVNLGPAVNSEFNEYGPALARDGKTLFFASNRPQPQDNRQPDPRAWPATVREDWFKRTYDLFRAEITADGPRTAVALTALNTAANEGAPCISPTGDFLYFASDRGGGFGGFDVYRARIVQGRVQTPVNLGSTINTAANELDPGLAQLGFALYFSSDRLGDGARSDGEKRYRVYFTNSREVFADRDPIDWAALWAASWPILAWILLCTLAALLLRQLIKDLRDRRLSLIARCLLASLLAHCLLMLCLGYWKVKAALGDYAGRGGKVRITLAAAGVGSDLYTQVRGGLIQEVNAPVALASETPRADFTPVSTPAMQPQHVDAAPSPSPPERTVAAMNVADAPPAAADSRAPQTLTLATAAPVVLTVPSTAAPNAETEATPAAAEARGANLTRPPVAAPAMTAAGAQRADLAPQRSNSEISNVGILDSVAEVREASGAQSLSAPAPAVALPPGGSLTAKLAVPQPTSQPSGANDERETGFADVAPLAAKNAPRPGVASSVVGAAHAAPVEIVPQGAPADAPRAEVSLVADLGSQIAESPVGRARSSPAGAGGKEVDLGVIPLALAAPKSVVPEAAKDAGGGSAASDGAGSERAGEAARTALGHLHGRVTDVETGLPLGNATIRFDQAQGEPLTATTRSDGAYTLDLVNVPDFFAVTATHDGYVPESRNVSGAAIAGQGLRLDISMRPATESVIAVEDAPEVHHLGNDMFEGAINSQFQRKTEGDQLVGEFRVSAAQAPPHVVRASVTLMAKGVQCPHQVRINGRLLSKRLNRSPRDGSFGEITLPIEPEMLHEGENQISIQAVECNGDLDDFEFVNVQIRLTRTAPEATSP